MRPFLLLLVAAACGASPPPFRLSGVTLADAVPAQQPLVVCSEFASFTLLGSGFDPELRGALDAAPQLVWPTVDLIGPVTVHASSGRIADFYSPERYAVSAATLPPGTYSVRMIDPDGQYAELPSAILAATCK